SPPSSWSHQGGPHIWEGTMKTPILSALAAAVVALGMSGGAAADTQTAAIEALERERAAATESLARARAPYPRFFARAYARYPGIPRGVLEAIAYAQTGWTHVAPDPAEDPRHRHMPPAYGVMGLYRGEGFDNQVRAGARLLGVDESLVVSDPATNILAAAALLDSAMRSAGEGNGQLSSAREGLEAMSDALARYAGYGPGDGGIQAYARQSFAYEVLQTLSRGVDAHGVRIPS